MLGDVPSLQEILWNFCCVKDEKQRLALKENPHFYAELPTSPEAYWESVKIDPTEDFQHADKFYVLVDKPELVHIKTDKVSQSFGNFWCPNDAIIFKGLGIPPFPLLFLITCQTFMGGSGGRASSRHLLRAHPVGSVSDSRCPLSQQLLGIVVNCSQLSQKGAHRRAGNVRLAVSQCTVLLLLACAFCAFVPGNWQQIVLYAATLSHINLRLLTLT